MHYISEHCDVSASHSRVFRLSISSRKGEKKRNVDTVLLRSDFGIVGDAHAGSQRQVSLLPYESFAKVAKQGLQVKPGEFAENITTIGLDCSDITIGSRLRIGETVELCITHIGKDCHKGCYIREAVGDCIMPREGLFARVIRGGRVQSGDQLFWIRHSGTS